MSKVAYNSLQRYVFNLIRQSDFDFFIKSSTLHVGRKKMHYFTFFLFFLLFFPNFAATNYKPYKMKRLVFSLMLCAGMTAQAQINEGLHWYNGQITFTARNIENKNVLLEAMDEGEEHELVLRYVKEVNQNHHVYRTDNGTHDRVNIYGIGTTVRHKKAEGWDVLCFYDDHDRLTAVMSGEEEWDAQKLNEARWKNMMMGEYVSEAEDEVELPIHWTWDAVSVNDIHYPYDVITFNGRVTGYITIHPVEGSINELEGTWEVVPTLRGFHLYAVNTETGSTPWEWQRDGAEFDFVESNPQIGRFFFACTTLLNDFQFRFFDDTMLRIMRNTILARHGYRFNSKDLQDYFGTEPWYKPAASNDDIRLSFVEKLNIELIQQMETKVSGDAKNDGAQELVFVPDLANIKPLDLSDGKDEAAKLFPVWDEMDIYEDEGVLHYDLNLGYNMPLQQLYKGLPGEPIDKNEVNRVILIDLNKDGFTDALVCLGRYGSEKTLYFDAYIWDEEEFGGLFTFVENFRQIPNPRIDKENSTILGRNGNDCEIWNWIGKNEIKKSQVKTDYYQ